MDEADVTGWDRLRFFDRVGRGGLAGGKIGVGGGEGGEVVVADQDFGRLLEFGEVEDLGAVPDVGGEHRRTDQGVGVRGKVSHDQSGGEDAVLVGLGDGTMAGVEAGGDRFDGQYADARGESAVKGTMQVGGWDGDVEGERGDLSQGMDAGVGAPGALREDGLSRDLEDGSGEGSLHGRQLRLNLPAVKRCPIVGKDCLPKLHRDAIGRYHGHALKLESKVLGGLKLDIGCGEVCESARVDILGELFPH